MPAFSSVETSTLTVIGTPPLAFRENFAFLQLVLGYLLARLVVATFFLPAYFRGEMYTAYELMRVRFGESVKPIGWENIAAALPRASFLVNATSLNWSFWILGAGPRTVGNVPTTEAPK